MEKYKCKFCEFKTNERSVIGNHYQYSHGNKKECSCPICKKIFKTEKGYHSHLKYNTCQSKINKKKEDAINRKIHIKENTNIMVICPICKKEFKFYGLNPHMWRKHGEGINFKTRRGKSKKIYKNNGKSYEEIFGIEKANILKEKISKSLIGKPRIITIEKELSRREKLSNSIKKRYESGWMPKAGRCKKIKYYSKIAGNVLLDGNWELNVAEYFDNNNINWKRNTQRFKYNNTIKNKISYYTPDFYLLDENKYIEIKGYETELDKIKWSQFTERLEVWKKNDLNLRGIKI